MFENFNNQERKSTIKEGIDLKSCEFKALKDFIGRVIYVDGFYFNKSQYGLQVNVVGHSGDGVDYAINMPNRYVEIFKKIADNDDQVNAILHGGLQLINIKSYDCKNGTKTTMCTFKG